MSVLYSQNGVIAKATESVDWFSNSPNFTMEQLALPIVYGTISNYPSNLRNGVFRTVQMNLASANTIEFNVKYKILGWNTDSENYAGQFYTGQVNKYDGIGINIMANKLEFFYYRNADVNNKAILYEDSSVSFAVNDIIEFKYIVDQQNSTAYIRFKQNGNVLVENTYPNVSDLSFSDNEAYNFLGIRFSVDSRYASPAQLYLDSTNFKKNGSVIWGSTKV